MNLSSSVVDAEAESHELLTLKLGSPEFCGRIGVRSGTANLVMLLEQIILRFNSVIREIAQITGSIMKMLRGRGKNVSNLKS